MQDPILNDLMLTLILLLVVLYLANKWFGAFLRPLRKIVRYFWRRLRQRRTRERRPPGVGIRRNPDPR
jgi:hypothetical protein